MVLIRNTLDIRFLRHVQEPKTNKITVPPSDLIHACISQKSDKKAKITIIVGFFLVHPALQVELVLHLRPALYGASENTLFIPAAKEVDYVLATDQIVERRSAGYAAGYHE